MKNTKTSEHARTNSITYIAKQHTSTVNTWVIENKQTNERIQNTIAWERIHSEPFTFELSGKKHTRFVAVNIQSKVSIGRASPHNIEFLRKN